MQVGQGTHVGRIRKVNEDSLWCDERLMVVADGMGGAAAGEVASQMAVSVLKEWTFPSVDHDPRTLKNEVNRAVLRANRRIYDASLENPQFQGMGTTLTMALLSTGFAVIGHVGDSRAYLVREGRLRQLTHDHSVVAEMVRSGELSDSEAEQHPYRNVLTRALGTSYALDVDIDVVELVDGDALLLCTDGLTAVVADDEIMQIIHRQRTAQRAIDALIGLANDRGGPDNISALLVYPGGNRRA